MKKEVSAEREAQLRSGAISGKSISLGVLEEKLRAGGDTTLFIRVRNDVCKTGVYTENGTTVFFFENDDFDDAGSLMYGCDINGIPLYTFQYVELIEEI